MPKQQLKPRIYQTDGEKAVYDMWKKGAKNVVLVYPTGSGKTFMFSHIIAQHEGYAVAIAHRQELVMQISCALASWGVYHQIFAPSKIIRIIVKRHIELFGEDYYRPGSLVTVAGIDTLLSRQNKLTRWFKKISLWVMDEAHHIQPDNKWGRIILDKLSHAKGLGVTATLTRTDGGNFTKVFQDLYIGPTLRDIIDDGYLTDYKIIGAPLPMDITRLKIGSSGDYTRKSLQLESQRAQITGDIVNEYRKYASGKRGVTFVTDIETAGNVAKAYNDAGVPAKAISHKDTDADRLQAIKELERGDILQLVNVDLFGEGFDLPAIEVVSFARPTLSYVIYAQQFGRVLRLMNVPSGIPTRLERLNAIRNSPKPYALIIDHVGNVLRHGLPDRRAAWYLENTKGTRKQRDPDIIPTRICDNPLCNGVYERILKACPYCGKIPEVAERSGPEFVDGVLQELDPKVLQKLLNDKNKIDMPVDQYEKFLISSGCPTIGVYKNIKYHEQQQQKQLEFRELMKTWAATYYYGESTEYLQKRFYWRFGVDVLTAQTLTGQELYNLAMEVIQDVIRSGNIKSGTNRDQQKRLESVA